MKRFSARSIILTSLVLSVIAHYMWLRFSDWISVTPFVRFLFFVPLGVNFAICGKECETGVAVIGALGAIFCFWVEWVAILWVGISTTVLFKRMKWKK